MKIPAINTGRPREEFCTFHGDYWSFYLLAGTVTLELGSDPRFPAGWLARGFRTRQAARKALRRCQRILAARPVDVSGSSAYQWDIVAARASF